MTEREKRIAIIGGTILAAILLLLWLRRGGGAAGDVITNQGDYIPGAVLGPVYYGGDDGAPFTWDIPGLDLSGPNLSMIGACCSDCMAGPMAQAAASPPVVSYGLQGVDPATFTYVQAPQQWTVHSNIVDASGNILVHQY